MCGVLKKIFPLGGINLASQVIKHSPIMPKPVKKVAKFVSKGGVAGVAARSLFGD